MQTEKKYGKPISTFSLYIKPYQTSFNLLLVKQLENFTTFS